MHATAGWKPRRPWSAPGHGMSTGAARTSGFRPYNTSDHLRGGFHETADPPALDRASHGGGRAARRRPAEGPEVHPAGRPAHPRPDRDHRLHHAQPRLHGVRHAVRDRREVPGPAADGGQVGGHQGRADLHVHAARRAQVPRRPAGEARPTASPRSSAGRSATRSARSSPKRPTSWTRGERQDLPAQAQEAVPARRSTRSPSRRPTCRSSCRSASPRPMPFKNIDDAIGSGPVQVRQGRVGAGQQGRLRQEHRLRAAQGSRRRGPPAARS